MLFNIKEKLSKQLIERYGTLRLIQSGLIACSVILGIITILEIFLPAKPANPNPKPTANTSLMNIPDFIRATGNDSTKTGTWTDNITLGRNLFKPATAIQDKPMADKTIERIKSQLSLQCIMKMAGRQVVYINIKGLGLKKLAVGDSVNDMFKVIQINENSVQLSIIEHKVFLRL